MRMKEKIDRALSRTTAVLLALAALAACLMLPQFFVRLGAERANDGVVLSLLYSDLKNRVYDMAPYLDRFREAGVSCVTLTEDTMAQLARRGDVLSLRYRDVKNSAVAEIRRAGALLENVEGITYDSHVYLANGDAASARLDEWLPLYYAENEASKIGVTDGGVSVYVFFDGNTEDYDVKAGYDADALALIRERGLDAALSMRVGSYSRVGYIENTASLIEKYGVRFLEVRKDSFSKETDEHAKENYTRVSELVEKFSLTLIVSENADQLSNVMPIGYDAIFASADGRVMRSFETYDCSAPDPTGYKFRSIQYLNSVVDRNIRFINVTQLALGGKSNDALAEDTAKAVALTRDKLSLLGYDIGGGSVDFDYEGGAYVPALAAAFTVLAAVAALTVVFGVRDARVTLAAAALSAAAFAASFAMPRAVILLYPTAAALAVPCLATALALRFVHSARQKLTFPMLAVGAAAIPLAAAAVGGVVMASLTSGLDYYINNDIFRGIKISLYAPLVFAAASYYVIFVKRRGSFSDDIEKALGARVRVWWCAAAALFGAVSFIYIIRSGNVSSISRAEEFMRDFITEHIAARPRTKEFLVAYPCAVLFAWYAKNGRRRSIPWMLAVGAAILPASVTNTFCHVFTDVRIQYGRLLSGLIFGAVTAATAAAVNYAAVRAFGIAKDRRELK